MNRHFLIVLLMVLTATGMNGQTRLIEHMSKPAMADVVMIPYSKYILDNGLTLIITEDHSDPIVHVDVTYHVGSAREELQKSGFAHFFEHMMFQGSKHVGDNEHFKIVTQAGGTMNGTTNRDRTNYFETLPSNYLETALWLEADRMGFLLDAVTKEKFENQRAVVKNEKLQSYDNRPYGRTSEVTDRNLYPFGHPYSWQTIGYVEDLNRVGVDDLKKFFMRWYGPNNAVLTIGGDVNTADVVKLAEKYFGPIPRGPEVQKAKYEYFALDKDRYVSLEDNVRFPMLRVVYPSVPNFHDDEAALDILSEILGQGKSSILYQNFVKSNKAISASAYNPCTELGGEFTFSVMAYPGTSLAETKKLLDSSLLAFEKRGITDLDLEKAKASKEADAIYSLESVAGKVSQLAMYETFLGTPNYISTDLERYRRVTKRDIMRVYESYVKDQHGLYISVYPKGKKDLIAAADNYTPGGDSSKAYHANFDTIKPRIVKDNFDRSKKPKAGKTPVVKAPNFFKSNRISGLKAVSVYNNEVPDIFMQFNVSAGQWRQPHEKQGIAYLTSRMLQESTYMMTAEQVADEAARIGTEVNIYPTEEDIVVTVHTLKKNFMQTMGLINEMLFHPAFKQEDFDRVKKQQLELIANQGTQPSAMASESFSRILYGENHPLGSSIYGTLASVGGNAGPNGNGTDASGGITLGEVKDYYETHFRPANTRLMISGDLDEPTLQQIYMFLDGWQGAMRPGMAPTPPGQEQPMRNPDLPPTPGIEKTKIYLVNKDKAPQSEIRVGYLAMPYDATGDYFKANLMNYVLGGAFNSRLNLNLREEKGWTYGIRSYFSGLHVAGPFRIAAGVRANVTDSSVFEILKEVKKYREKGITKDELEFTRQSLLDREALRYETNQQKVGYVERVMEYNAPDDYVAQQAHIVEKIKKKEIDKLAEQYLPVDKMVIVVVGDAKKLRGGLEKLGYEVVDVKAYE